MNLKYTLLHLKKKNLIILIIKNTNNLSKHIFNEEYVVFQLKKHNDPTFTLEVIAYYTI